MFFHVKASLHSKRLLQRLDTLGELQCVEFLDLNWTSTTPSQRMVSPVFGGSRFPMCLFNSSWVANTQKDSSVCLEIPQLPNHLRESLLDQAQARASYTRPLFLGVVCVAYPKVWFLMSNTL